MWVELPGYVARLSPGEGFGFKFDNLSETESVVVDYLIDFLEAAAEAADKDRASGRERSDTGRRSRE
jgi:hypothetical protein